MFRSKSFTIAFSILALLIIGLTGILLYLVFGKGREMLEQGFAISTEAPVETLQTDQAAIEANPNQDPNAVPATAEGAVTDAPSEEKTTKETTTEKSTEKETTTEETTETEPTLPADTSVRALNAEEPHNIPIIGEDIPENGVITIIKSGDNGEGIVFHASPKFDAADTPGNLTNFSGSFDIRNKIYILNNGSPFLLYKTFDNYYVTSSPVYMSYMTENGDQRTVQRDSVKIGDYGLSESEEVAVRIYHEDGNHLVFTVYNFSPASGELLPVLENVIAKYRPDGSADFEYHNSDGQIHTGVISFEVVEGQPYPRRLMIRFESPVKFRSGEKSELVLHN